MNNSWNGFRYIAAIEDDTAQDRNDQPALVKQLQELLADVAIFYHTVHEFHWNVTGHDFYEYHKLYDEIVSDVYDSIDPIAENIRKLGGYTRYKMSELIKLADLQEIDGEANNSKTLTNHLVVLNSKLINTLMNTFNLANKSNQQGIANFIAERIDMHQKWNWFLKASGE